MEEAILRDRNRLKALTAELRARNAQLQADLQMAREVQEALLPHDYPTKTSSGTSSPGSFVFAHCYRPAEAVSGDFFDIIPLSENRYGVFMCDVMGHGMRAALITAIIRGLLEELRGGMDDPGRFMTVLNMRLRAILQSVEDPFLTTAFYLVVDNKAREIQFSNAGHPAPICVHFSKNGEETLPCLIDLTGPWKRPGSALGLFDGLTYKTITHPFENGDRMLLFTDGLYEIDSPKGEEFGRARLFSSVKKYAALSIEKLLAAIFSDIAKFASKKGFEDDVCIIAMERLK